MSGSVKEILATIGQYYLSPLSKVAVDYQFHATQARYGRAQNQANDPLTWLYPTEELGGQEESICWLRDLAHYLQGGLGNLFEHHHPIKIGYSFPYFEWVVGMESYALTDLLEKPIFLLKESPLSRAVLKQLPPSLVKEIQWLLFSKEISYAQLEEVTIDSDDNDGEVNIVNITKLPLNQYHFMGPLEEGRYRGLVNLFTATPEGYLLAPNGKLSEIVTRQQLTIEELQRLYRSVLTDKEL